MGNSIFKKVWRSWVPSGTASANFGSKNGSVVLSASLHRKPHNLPLEIRMGAGSFPGILKSMMNADRTAALAAIAAILSETFPTPRDAPND